MIGEPAAAIIAIGAFLACHWLMIAALVRHYRQNTLSPHRAAIVIASGWGCSILLFFFVNLILGGLVPMSPGLIALGLGVGALNFVIAYPLAYYLHKHTFSRMRH